MASKSSDGWIVWVFLAGLGAWWAYEAMTAEKPRPSPPPPVLSARPTGLISIGEDNDGTRRYLDADSVRGDRSNRRGWIISDHAKDKTVTQRETKQMIRADCDEGSYTMPSYVTYDAKGAVLSSWDESDTDKARVFHPAPDTIGESNFDAVCRYVFDPTPIPPPIPAK